MPIIIFLVLILLFNWLFTGIMFFIPTFLLHLLESISFYIFLALGMIFFSWLVGHR